MKKKPTFQHNPFSTLKGKKISSDPPSKAIVPKAESLSASHEDEPSIFTAANTGTRPLALRDKYIAANLPSNPAIQASLHGVPVSTSHSVFVVTENQSEIAGHIPDLSHTVMQRLLRGGFPHQRVLDLHGLASEHARQELIKFILKACEQQLRCVLVVTGRGTHSPAGIAILRTSLPQWLTEVPLRSHILAFCTSQPIDGGDGAFYILLRRKKKA